MYRENRSGFGKVAAAGILAVGTVVSLALIVASHGAALTSSPGRHESARNGGDGHRKATADITSKKAHPPAVAKASSGSPECTPEDLSNGNGPGGSEHVAAYVTVFAIGMTNSSSAPCSLAGYPTISWLMLVNETPPAVPDTAAVQTNTSLSGFYGPGFVASQGSSNPVVIAPGQNALFYLNLEDGSSTAAESDTCAHTIESASFTFAGWSTSIPLGSLPTCPGNPFWVSPVGLEGTSPFVSPTG